MGYSWQDVQFALDVKNESEAKAKERKRISKKQIKEEENMALWGTALSVLGSVFGPAGMFVGKKLGEWGADYLNDWETESIDPGKFNVSEAKEYNKSIKEAATEQTQGQALGTLTDLATMYVQAGGMTEGLDADFTTFGAGGDQWSVFGKKTGPTWSSQGSGGMINPNTGKAIGSASRPYDVKGLTDMTLSDAISAARSTFGKG